MAKLAPVDAWDDMGLMFAVDEVALVDEVGEMVPDVLYDDR